MKTQPTPRVWSGNKITSTGGTDLSNEPSAPNTLPPNVLEHLPPDSMILIPLRDKVLFPEMVLPVTLQHPAAVAAAQEAIKHDWPIGFILQRDADTLDVGPQDLHTIGTKGLILRYITGQDETHYVVVQGETRFQIVEFLEGWPFMVARVTPLKETENDPQNYNPEIQARFDLLKEQATRAINMLPNVSGELVSVVRSIKSAPLLSHMVANLIDIAAEKKQEILESVDLLPRLDKVIALFSARLNVLQLSREINEKTRAQFDEREREYVLREQLRQIQKELGEDDDTAAEIEELRKVIENANMHDEVLSHARKELKRLQRMNENGGEYAMLRTYLEWLTEIPWKQEEHAPINIADARKVLDEDHFGLEKIKRRILEYLAVRKLNPSGKSPVLCFVGPPGVGKTSLGQSIAHATGRVFQRIALGGVHSEAEIRGHRRTYLGALPGNIIQAMRRAKTNHVVLMLDEIDKLGTGSFQGDPSSALLEVLDPEQNHKFRDNYLGIDYDLSRVMFICTANMLDNIQGPLHDRMEIIHIPGYTEEEKIQIARRYLIQRELDTNGLKNNQIKITDPALTSIVSNYTREAGVRNLEREIGTIMRHVAMQIVEEKCKSMTIDADDLAEPLGPVRFENEVALRTSIPGVATGLAWTPVGGDILFIEATKAPGTGKFLITGNLGDVMKESAQAALTNVKIHEGNPLAKMDVHIHIPAGATPKDGPSAGVAMFVALASLLRNKPIPPHIAMTGEISLRGAVLPIGGIKEKSLAALRSGITTIMLPKRNEKDLKELPKEAREGLKFIFLENIEEALHHVLEN